MSSPSPSSIRDVFEALVPEYDWFNRVGSLGLDVRWRAELARLLKEKSHLLDVGTGTGEVARLLAQSGARVRGIDFSGKMIQAARRKFHSVRALSFEVARADQLPFEDGSFDGISSAFVIRNLNHEGILGPSFREFFRVLQNGGVMVHLELTRPPRGLLSLGHDFYMKVALPIIGRAFFKGRWPKNYLRRTIHDFPQPPEVCQRMRWAGFKRVSHYPLHGGLVSLFCGVKC